MNSAHALLSQVSEHKRDTEGDILQQLTVYRGVLTRRVDESKHVCETLLVQRETKMVHGSEASELMMLEQSLAEHQQRIFDIKKEMESLDLAIRQQREKWAEQHKKHKAHEKMHHQIESETKRVSDKKHQKNMDDQFSSTMFEKGRV